MTTSTAETTAAARAVQRPARWPWIVFALFLVIASLGLVFISLNHELLSTQIPYVVAFSMFGVVGTLIVSRDRTQHDRVAVALVRLLDGDVVPRRRVVHATS